jgi:hypothetical protein
MAMLLDASALDENDPLLICQNDVVPWGEEPCSPLPRWEGACGVEDDAEEEFDHAAALAALLAIGTQVICRSMTPAPPLVANSCAGTGTQI